MRFLLFAAAFLFQFSVSAAPGRRLELLFLGDKGHHKPFDRYPALQSAVGIKGMNITYTESLKDLNEAYLNKFDALVIYANHDSIAAPQEKALLNYVASGHGLVAIHCASFNFRNSKEFVKMVGGQFWRHGMDSIRVKNEANTYVKIKTVDETYLHSQLQPDNQIWQSRILGPEQAKDKPGATTEPYTWTRTYGKGNVFYTAYGHDERTWETEGFQDLVTQGILHAVGAEKRALLTALNLPVLKYREAKLPNYEKREGAQLQQLPLSPEESVKFIQVPVDFNLQVFASEPNVMHPIAMAWDERGRLYVLITKDYPNERKETGGSDYILLCEDTNNDGKADKFTKWADGLSIPTGMVFANGGLIISQAPHVILLKDTNGDDKADEKKILFTGFGTGDTHAGPSNLHYGFDNWIWGCVGYSGYKGKVGADSLQFAQAFFRFKPDGSKMEHMTTTSNNTWGFDFNESGDVFGSTANNAHGWYMAIPHRNIWHAPMTLNGSKNTDTHKDMRTITKKVRQVDVFGGFTAAAGHNFYSARSFPKEYWNQIAFVSEPTGHVIHQNRQVPTGSDFNDKEAFNFLAGADEWVSPVFAQVGPDGAVWVADWYSYIIQHNPVPQGFKNGGGNAYDTDLRDFTHGRIYRVGYNKAPAYTPVSLKTPAECIAALSNSNLFWRLNAQRLLVERGNKDVVPALVALIGSAKTDEIGLAPGAIHALRTLEGLGVLPMDVLARAMKHSSAAVRKQAVQVLPRTAASAKLILDQKMLNDKDSLVVLHSILALIESPTSPAVEAAMARKIAVSAKTTDRWIPDALAAYVMAGGPARRAAFISKQGAQSGAVVAEKLAKEAKNPSSTGTESGLDLVVEEVQIKGGNFRLREGASFVIRVKNRGDKALPKGTPLPLTVKIEGMGRRTDLESYTFTDGAAPGETVSVVKNNNGPWTGNLGWTADEAGNYVMEINLDTKAVLGESNRNNNTFRQPIVVSLPADLGSYIVEKTFRGMTSDDSANDIVALLRSIKQVASPTMGAALKGASATWNAKRAADLSADNVDFLKGLGKQLRPQDVEAYERLAGLWKVEIPSAEVKGVVVKRTIMTIKEAMKYSPAEFTVPAGATVELIFENVDAMQHNWVLGTLGSQEKIGLAADKMITAADGAAKNYIPAMPEVLAYTPLVESDGRVKVVFKAPSVPGNYPFLCTFPGHWRIMNGIMKVE
ncbi:PVC-type heme-binding CxxCH protein [Aquirufa novilacunae]|uniref:PVC-type heme-binding CxxCH protein n=1 Tax=Aquirufa novilacunae TaxID=3139305 RepID=A0ABW8U220_9BACT